MSDGRDVLANKTGTEDDDAVIDDGVMAGSRDVKSMLEIIKKDHGAKAAMGYAGGMLAGLRSWLCEKHGLEATEDLFFRMADDIAADVETGAVGVLQ